MALKSKEEIKAIIESTETPPLAFQALWDTTEIEWLILSVVYEKEGVFFKKKMEEAYPRYHLGHFDTNEEIIAYIQELGDYFSTEYAVEFYFPSKEDRNDDCPNWWDRTKCVCADCKTPIRKSFTNDYFPEIICFNCMVRRQHAHSLIKNHREYDTLRLLIFKPSNEVIGMATYSSSKILKEYFPDIKFNFKPLTIIELDAMLMERYKLYLENTIESMLNDLPNYKYNDNEKYIDRTYKGISYTIETRRLRILQNWIEEYNQINFEKDSIKIYISYRRREREDVILSCIGRENEPTTIELVMHRLEKFANKRKVLYSINKLIRGGILERTVQTLRLTEYAHAWYKVFYQ
jgi:hypothetical protein